jgi:alkylated DNA repair dioxygenase AlkB
MEESNSIIINKLNDKPSFFYYKDDIFSDDDFQFLYNLNYKEGNYDRNDNESIKVSRKQMWFQVENKYFCPIWKKRLDRWKSECYSDELISIQNKVQNYINDISSIFDIDSLNINSCLINYYETGNNFIPAHKDSQLSFGEYPTIICISYGDTRTMILKNKDEQYSFNLKSNSIFIMAGSSQKYYTHEIEKKSSLLPRYSLTFRHFIL